MKIKLVFKPPFNHWFEQSETFVDLPENSTVRTVVNGFVQKKGIYKILKEKNALFMDELSAVFMVNGLMVKREYILQENDTVTLLNMIIG